MFDDQEHVDYAAAPTSDEEAVAFSDAYHALIHSPALVSASPA